jgi:hypothetical protein
VKPFKLKHSEPKEADVLSAVLTCLRFHPRVAWAHRMQTGAGKIVRKHGATSQFLRFGWPGASDVIGQFKGTGQLLAVEVKRPSGQATPEQLAFLQNVRDAGGVAILARSVDDVMEALK